MADELTIKDLMKRCGITRRQAEYRLERAGIEPTRRIGSVRVFDRRAVEAIELSAQQREHERKAKR